MKAIDLKGKIRFVFAVFAALLILQGNSFAQNKSDKDDNSDKRENAYNRVARDLTSRLSKRVNLTKDQVGKVQDILVDYQKDIADKWNKNSADVTGSKDNVSDDYRDADKKANDKIEKTLNGNEVTSYINVKKDWWAKVKDRVYSRDFIDLVNYKEQDEDNNVGSTDRNRNEIRDKDKSDKTANTSGTKDQNAKFEPFAKQMATELMQKLNLSLQQAADIQDALIDYQKSIADIRQKNVDNRNDNVRVANNDRNRDRDNRSENVGSSKDNRMSEFRDIDDSANDKIEKVFDNDNQKAKYERVKKGWWKEVKDKVYANIQHENRSITSKNK